MKLIVIIDNIPCNVTYGKFIFWPAVAADTVKCSEVKGSLKSHGKVSNLVHEYVWGTLNLTV